MRYEKITKTFLLIILNLVIAYDARASLVPTRTIKLKKVEGWAISASIISEGVSCRAEKKPRDGDNYTVIYSPVAKYRHSSWYLGIVSRSNSLPENVDEVDAIMYSRKDKQALLSGKILNVGDSKGGKRISSYIRVEFLNLETKIDQLKANKSLLIKSKESKAITLNVPSLRAMIEALESCHQKITNKYNNQKLK